jgi:hypothetical protein
MKNLLLSLAAIALFSAGVLSATDAHAQACLQIGAKAGDQVRLNTGSVSAFWFQEMDLTVKSFTEFSEVQTNPGGSFCGAVRVQISGSLVPGGMGQNDIILLADTSLKPGTRLHLDEFVYSNNLFACFDVGPTDTCMWNGDLFRTATVGNR